MGLFIFQLAASPLQREHDAHKKVGLVLLLVLVRRQVSVIVTLETTHARRSPPVSNGEPVLQQRHRTACWVGEAPCRSRDLHAARIAP
jgi:hypothetical protein